MLCLLMVFGAFSVLLGTVAGDTDGNDSFVNAEQITSGTYHGNLTYSTDEQDFYKFDVAAGQIFTVNFSVGGPDTGRIYTYDKAQSEWRSSDYINPGLSWSDKFTLGQSDAGTYYIKIIYGNGDGGATDYNFTLTIFDQFDGLQVGDAGDTPVTARTITAPITFTGWVADLDAKDCYVFSVPNGNMIVAKLTTGTLPDQNVRLYIDTPDKNSLMSSDWVNPGLSATLTFQTSDTTGGNYYLELVGDTQNYTVDLSLVPENDSGSGTDVAGLIDNAYMLPGNGTYNGSLRDDDKADFYKLNITGGMIMDFTIAAGITTTDTVRMHVYKPDKNALSSTDWLNPGISYKLEYVTNNLGAGLYYIEVDGSNTYTLTILLTMQNDTGRNIDAADDINSATGVNLNTEYTGMMRDMDTQDYYQFVATAGMGLVINFTNVLGDGTLRATIYKPDKNQDVSSTWMNQGVLGQLNYTAATGGTYYFLLESSNSSYKFNLTVPPVINDTIKPVVVILSPANGASVSLTPTINGTASDNTGISKVEISIDGGAFTTVAGTTIWTTTATLLAGSHNITARATDLGGNINTTTIAVTASSGGTVNDTVKPVVAILVPTSGSKVSKNKLAVISGTATDNVAVTALELKVNGVTVTNTFLIGAWVATNVSLKEGKNTIVVTATDAAGNVGTQTVTVTYEKPKPQPGFETLFLVAAIVVGLVLLNRRRS